MKGNSFHYLLKEGAKNVWYNRLMSLASVGVLTACLLLVGFAVLFSINVDSMVGYVEQQNEAVVFVLDSATDEEVAALKSTLENDANLFDVRFVSKDEALQRQRERLGSEADALNGYENKNPFPASFEVRVRDLETLGTTVKMLEQLDGVEKVNASTEVASVLTSARKMVNLIGGIVVVALIIVSLVIISNTIRASVFTRRREISIMKYVGATDGFIRLPFLVEGLVLGFVAAALAFIITWACYSGLVGLITKDASSLLTTAFKNIVTFKSVALRIGGCFLGAGLLTGVIGSLFSIRGHLKV